MNNTENTVITQFDFTLIADFFRRLDQQGPGGDAETLRALSFVTADLPVSPKIADIGCGTGRQTVVLANALNGTVTATDLLPEMLEGLRRRLERERPKGRVTPVLASMDNLPFGDEEYDLIWSEGAIDNIGFGKGLAAWRRHVKTGGFVVVTESSWLSSARPTESDWLTANLPEIDSIPNKLHIMESAGYMPVAHFILPEHCWTENYYAPMWPRMEEFVKENGNSAAATAFVERMKEEIACYEANKALFGYVFYIGRKI